MPETEKWYSVSDAAAYLGVSEPTIFRWMKEGLDAVVEKSTGRKEAEASAGRCAACGHGTLIPGRFQGAGKLYFKPEKTKFWVWTESLVGTVAKVCAACGYLHLYADTEKLSKLKPEEKA